MTRLLAEGQLGAALVRHRLWGRGGVWIGCASVAFALLASYAERREGSAQAATRALHGPVFGLVIPFAMLAIVAHALSRRPIHETIDPAALLGAGRRGALVGMLLCLSAWGVAVGLLVAAGATLVGHGAFTRASVLDGLTAAWIGALVSVVYVALFVAASTFGRGGGMRSVVLVVDLVLGVTGSTASWFSPRAHGLNMLGVSGGPPGGSQPASCAALVLLALLFGLIALRRVKN